MNVLVTGATGFIGRPLVQRLLAREHRVRALLRIDDEACAPSGADPAFGDVRDAAAVERATRGVDAVVHLACATGVSRMRLARAVNVEGTRHVLDAARANGVQRVIFVSSISVTRERVGPYGTTKREGEALIAVCGLEWVILRPSLVYGSGATGLFPLLVRSLRGPLMPLIENGSTELDPVHVDDVCAVIEECLTRPDVVGKTYDLLGPERLTFAQLLRRLATASGASPRFVPLPGSVALPLARVLGWMMVRPPLSVDNVLGMVSPARVDGSAARRDFDIDWTSLDSGLEGLNRTA